MTRLGVAAGGDHQRIWVGAGGPAEPLAAFAVGYMGHGAGVDYIHLGRSGWRHNAKACRLKIGYGFLGVTLVYLAAKGDESHARSAVLRLNMREVWDPIVK